MILTICYTAKDGARDDAYFVAEDPTAACIAQSAYLRFIPTDAAAPQSRLAAYGYPVCIPFERIASWSVRPYPQPPSGPQ